MKRIILIEDDPQYQKLLKTALEDAGYEMRVASNGKVGCELYHENPSDLVITDIFMPEKEGIETILELKEDFSDIKILAISGGGNRGELSYLDMAKDMGAEAIMPKPIKIADLITKVEEMIGR